MAAIEATRAEDTFFSNLNSGEALSNLLYLKHSSNDAKHFNIAAAPGVNLLKPFDLKAQNATFVNEFNGSSKSRASFSTFCRQLHTAKAHGENGVDLSNADTMQNGNILSSVCATDIAYKETTRQESKCVATSRSQSSQSSKWYELPFQPHTPEILRELKAVQLRGYAQPAKFYKRNDFKTLPTHFQFAKVVDGELKPVGEGPESQAANVTNYRKKQGTSLLQEFLKDETVKRFTAKRYREIQSVKKSGGKTWYKRQRAKRRK